MCVKEKNVINNLIRKKNRDKRNEIKINECMVIIIFAHHISLFFSRYFIVSFCHYIFVFIFYILSFDVSCFNICTLVVTFHHLLEQKC